MNSNKRDQHACEPPSPLSSSSSTTDQSTSKSSVNERSCSSTVPNENYTREKIQYLLKHNKTEYVIIENSISNNKYT